VGTSPAPDGEVPAGSPSAAPILVIAVLVGLLAAGGVALARRSSSS
jgi:LPS O-antigen subunit length determinant protein (WzzB/FepE family)